MNLYLFAIREDIRQPLNILLILLIPFSLLFIPANADGFPMGINLYGLVLVYSTFLLTRPVVEDRMKGIVVRIAASPMGTFRYLSNHLLAYLTLITVQIVLFLIGSLVMYGDAVFDRLSIFALYFSFSIMCIAFSLAWNSLFRTFNLSFGVFSGVASIMCLASGISIPLFLLPRSLIGYIMFLPTYWLPHGLLAIYEGDSAGMLVAHAVLLFYAVIFLLVGSKRRL